MARVSYSSPAAAALLGAVDAAQRPSPRANGQARPASLLNALLSTLLPPAAAVAVEGRQRERVEGTKRALRSGLERATSISTPTQVRLATPHQHPRPGRPGEAERGSLAMRHQRDQDQHQREPCRRSAPAQMPSSQRGMEGDHSARSDGRQASRGAGRPRRHQAADGVAGNGAQKQLEDAATAPATFRPTPQANVHGGVAISLPYRLMPSPKAIGVAAPGRRRRNVLGVSRAPGGMGRHLPPGPHRQAGTPSRV